MNNINPTYVDVHPISRFSRFLVHFCDMLLSFFLSLFLFSVLIFPVGNKITGYDSISQDSKVSREKMADVLFENSLLSYQEKGEEFTISMTYSSKCYLNGFLKNDTENEYFRHYYVDFLKDESSYLEFYRKNGATYFDVTDKVMMKEDIRNLLLPSLDEKDTLSTQGSETYRRFTESFFPNLYSVLVKDLLSNEKISSESPLYQYRISKERIDVNQTKQDWIISVSAYLSYLVSTLICFLMIPMISRRGKTLSMMCFRVERVGKDNLRILRRRERLLSYAFHFIFNLTPLMLIPSLYIDFATLFSIPGLLTFSLIGLGFVLVSFVFMCFNELGRTLSDFLTKSVYLSKDDLEKLAMLKGYHVHE